MSQDFAAACQVYYDRVYRFLLALSGDSNQAEDLTQEVFQDVEGLKAVGLTVPDTTELLWQLRQDGLDLPLDALSDEECAQALYQLLKT